MQINFSGQKPHYAKFLPLLFSPSGRHQQVRVLSQSSKRCFCPAFKCRFTFPGGNLIMPLFSVWVNWTNPFAPFEICTLAKNDLDESAHGGLSLQKQHIVKLSYCDLNWNLVTWNDNCRDEEMGSCFASKSKESTWNYDQKVSFVGKNFFKNLKIKSVKETKTHDLGVVRSIGLFWNSWREVLLEATASF